MRTVKDILDENRGLGPGFDFLRVALAIGVVAWHAELVATGVTSAESARVFWFPGYAILTMFFGLSGFLIAGSAMRLKLRDFLTNRGMRIFPALAVEIIMSALVLGAVFTSLPLPSYFTSPQTYHYFTNIVGLINYHLPNVFGNNPTNSVNFSLWTVPYELGCYAIMSGLILAGTLKRRAWLLMLTGLYLAVSLGLYLALGNKHGGIMYSVIDKLFLGRGSRLFASFLMGIAAYLWRDRIVYDRRLIVAAVAACFVVSLLRPLPWLSMPVLNLFAAPLTVYLCVLLGATRIPPLPLFRHGDYSYGVYLYGVPIQQAVRATVGVAQNPLLGFLLSVPLITAFAVFSWHFIEKPILKLRRKFSFVARARGVEGPQESLVNAPPPVQAGGEVLSYGDASGSR